MGSPDLKRIRGPRHSRRFGRKTRAQARMLKTRRHQLNRGPCGKIGLEFELQVIKQDGRPAFGSSEIILRELAAELGLPLDNLPVTFELGNWQLEITATPRELRGRPLTEMFDEVRGLLSRIARIAATHRWRIITIGILPTVTPEDAVPANRSPVRRYKTLDHSLWHGQAAGELKLNTTDGTQVTISVGSVMCEAPCTSVQPHVELPGIDEFRWHHDIVMATAGVIGAVFTGGSLPFGTPGGKDARQMLFHVSVRDRCRVEGYTRDAELFGTINQALALPPVACKRDWGPAQLMYWLARLRRKAYPFTALKTRMGTTWPMVSRTILGDDGQNHSLRDEVRYCSSGTLEDVMSFVALIAGLLLNQDSRRYAKLITEEAALANFTQFCERGVDGDYYWPGEDGGLQLTPAPTAVRELAPMARAGWASIGLASEADRFLKPLANRVKTDDVMTMADWLLYRVRYYRRLQYDNAEAVRLATCDVAKMCDNGLGPSIGQWPDPTTAELPGRSAA